MTLVALLLVVWATVSVPLALAIGGIIRHGRHARSLLLRDEW